jgi:hypothetical protein
MPENRVTPKAGPVAQPPAAPPSPARPLRFSWPMRVFLFVLLFDVIFRSFAVVLPWGDWIDELGMQRAPAHVLTRDKYIELRDQGGDKLRQELDESFASVRDYFNPWPKAAVRAKLTSWDARGKYVVAWLASRLDIVENMCGINEEWPMFSPNVSKGKYVTRAVLQYADGTACLVRQNSEPADLTRFTHWNVEKILDHETKVQWKPGRFDECWGWCNLLAHRYPRNEQGSTLVKILLYRVRIELPSPGQEPRSFYLKQMELIRDAGYGQASDTFFTFDAKTREATMEKMPE